MNIDVILENNKRKASNSKLLKLFDCLEDKLAYNTKAEITFNLLFELKQQIRYYEEYFIFGKGDRCLTTIPVQAKKVNKILNLIKKSCSGLPRDLVEYYAPITNVDNVKELMLEDLQFLAGEQGFEIDEVFVGKKYKKA